MMKTRKKINYYLSTCLALIIFFASNSCVFEHFFFYAAANFTEINLPKHLDNHIGSNIPHKHTNEGDADSDSHQHCQPQLLGFFNIDKSGSSFQQLLQLSIFFVGILAITLTHALILVMLLFIRLTALQIDREHLVKRFISNLKSAPQAPPAFC